MNSVLASATIEFLRQHAPFNEMDTDSLVLIAAGARLSYHTAGTMQALDIWLDAFGISAVPRHHALADALATAQLLLVLQCKAAERGIRTVSALRKAAAGEAWLAGGTR